MKFIKKHLERRYGRWMHQWEDDLCSRATDRIVRPFDFGLEWVERWPVTSKVVLNGHGPGEYLAELNRHAIENSDEFFGYATPRDFRLNDGFVEFTSPVDTPYPENNTVKAQWFPAKNNNGKAVVVLPHWNASLSQHGALCRGIAKMGISALRLSLPYHDLRMPAELRRADYAVSANVARTIDSTRQAVIDTRCCFDWLEQQGYQDLGIIGTSLGSCYAFLASAHDHRIRVNVFNHCSTYFADVVWEGLSSRHIRESLEEAIDRETLRELWSAISPPSYSQKFAEKKKRSKFIYTRYDTTFPLHLSEQVIQAAREWNWDHEAAVLPCGHYTLGEFPFKFMAGYHICSFLKKNL